MLTEKIEALEQLDDKLSQRLREAPSRTGGDDGREKEEGVGIVSEHLLMRSQSKGFFRLKQYVEGDGAMIWALPQHPNGTNFLLQLVNQSYILANRSFIVHQHINRPRPWQSTLKVPCHRGPKLANLWEPKPGHEPRYR